MSHYLRNPLHSILASSDILRTAVGPGDNDCIKALDNIASSTERMAQVISDLMTLSRITKQEVHRGEINLSEIVRTIIEELKTLDPGRAVACVVEPSLFADADDGLMRILLENLIHNAWKFSSRKADARIEFGMPGSQPPVYFVRDNGVGFDMAVVDRLFEPFHRLHLRHEYSGTGIGLTIVKRIVEKHYGAVWAESGKNKGATFYFRLG